MTSRETDAPKKMRPWLRWVLVASLALNVAVIGAVGGAALRFGPDADGRPPRMDQVVGRYTKALTKEDRRKIGRKILAEQRQNLPPRSQMRADFEQMIAALRADPFDVETADAVLRRQRAFGEKRAELGHALLLDHLKELSPEERHAFADRLLDGLKKGSRELGKPRAGPDGKRPEH